MGVFNAQQYVSQSIESILTQDYPNFELIISDNGSQDGTAQICRSYAARDARILYRRNETNINPMLNAKILLELSSGVYHHWAADHDIYHPKYLSGMVGLLESEGESLVLAYPHTGYIDIHGKKIKNIREDIDTRGLKPTERFKKVMWGLIWCTPMYGLFRSSALKKIWKMRSLTGPDRVILPELSLLGEYALHEEQLFFMRQNRPAEKPVEMIQRQIDWFVANKLEAMMPSIMRNYELIKVVHDSNLDTSAKEELVEEILRWNHADPKKHNMSEVRNLVIHGSELLNSEEVDLEEKQAAAVEYLRLAEIGRIFRPELGAQLDRLCGLSRSLMQDTGGRVIESGRATGVLSFKTDSEETWPNAIGLQTRPSMVMPSEDNPLVSIGLPVSDSTPFLEKTIASLLAQTYPNFELLIADYGSGLGSRNLCDHFASKDRRIRLLRNLYNIGSIASHHLVLHTSTGPLFMWSTGQDVYDPEFLALLVREFKISADSIAACYPDHATIDRDDRLMEHVPQIGIDTRGMEVEDRYRSAIWNFKMESFYSGLFNASVLKQIWNPYTARGPLHVIPAKIGFLGSIAHVDRELFYRRIPSGRNRCGLADGVSAMNSLSIRDYENTIPFTMLAFEHIEMVRNSNLVDVLKAELFLETKKCFSVNHPLQEEAIQFLKHGVETFKRVVGKSVLSPTATEQLIQLSNICAFFNPDHKIAFERFNGLIRNAGQVLKGKQYETRA